MLFYQSAAFDTVNHHTLLCDIENLSIISWFKTYFTNGEITFIVNDKKTTQNEKFSTTGHDPTSCVIQYLYTNSALYAKLLQHIIWLLCWRYIAYLSRTWMIRKCIWSLTVKIIVSQKSILFSMLYKRSCLKENWIRIWTRLI